MKEHDKDRPDPRPDSAPRNKLSAKPKDTGGVEGALHNSISVTKTDAGQAGHPDLLRHEHLSHPANAGQLASILSELQQSHGNAYVQQVVSRVNESKPCGEAPTTGGQTLEGGVKSEMEAAFGERFDDVRIHTGSAAEKMNEELGARAVARGRDIYFDAGEYNPATQEGKKLLAHELTHVVQQAGDSTGKQAGSVDQPGDKFEEEADRAASAVLSGQRAHVVNRSAAPSHQRMPPTRQPAQQPTQPPPPTVLLPMVIDLGRHPSGPLAVGVTYNFTPPASASNSYHLQVWVPAGGTVTSVSGPIIKILDSSTPFLSRPVLIEVARVRGQPAQIVVRFNTIRLAASGPVTASGTNQFDVRFIFPAIP